MSAEEVLKKWDLNFDWMTSKSYKNIVIAAMEEYASQFKVEILNDSEIKKEANKRFIEWEKKDWSEAGAMYDGFIEGASFALPKTVDFLNKKSNNSDK